VTEVLSVVEHAGKESVGADRPCSLGRDWTDAGDLAHLTLPNVGPAALGDRMAHDDHEFGTPGASFPFAGEQSGVGVGEMALERLHVVGRLGFLLGFAMKTRRLRFGAVDDRRPEVRLQGHMNVHHSKVVGIAPPTARRVLTLREVFVLLGLELHFARSP
jgi:hypothetical protein